MIGFTRFAERVLRLRLTRAQYVVARVAFDGVDPKDLDGGDRELAMEIFAIPLETVPAGARRTHVWRFGRSSGKSLLAAARVVHRMLVADLSRCGPGDQPTALVIAPEKHLAQIAFRAGKALLHGSPELVPLIVRETAETITIRRPDGLLATFMVVPKSQGGRAARGRSLIEVLFDESEFMPAANPAAAIQDAEVIDAVYPRLLPGGEAILASTPWPAISRTASVFEANYGKPSTALAARGATLLLRNNDPQTIADRDAMMAENPHKALREYDCIITDAEGGFFESTAIDRAKAGSVTPQRHHASSGIDLAFRSDASALVVLERQGDKLVEVHTEMVVPKPDAPLKPSVIVGSFAAAARSFGCRELVADGHYIESAREHAAGSGVSVVSAPSGPGAKEQSFLYVRDLLREGLLVLQDVRLIAQLKSVLGIPQPGGGIRIVLPRRSGAGHADLVSALVVACAYDRRHGPLLRKGAVPEIPQAVSSGFSWR